jgi:hypothetical protein
MIKITLPASAYDTFKEDIRESVDRGYFIEFNGDTLVQETDGLFFTLADAQAIVAVGGEVEGLPLFLELTALKYDNQVPVGIPNRSVTDTEGNTTVLKWNEWKASNMTHAEYGGKYYVPLNANVAGGEYLPASIAVTLIGLTGYTLKTTEEYREIQQANSE